MDQPNIFTDDAAITDLTKTRIVRGKQFLRDPDLSELGQKVIDEQELDIGDATIDYMLVYPKISKKVAGRCKRCSKELEYYTGNDFLIQMSGEVWDMLGPETRYTLMYHELLHIKAVWKAKDQEWAYSLRPHDFEDFYEIIDTYGLDWFKTIQQTTASLYDLDLDDETSVNV